MVNFKCYLKKKWHRDIERVMNLVPWHREQHTPVCSHQYAGFKCSFLSLLLNVQSTRITESNDTFVLIMGHILWFVITLLMTAYIQATTELNITITTLIENILTPRYAPEIICYREKWIANNRLRCRKESVTCSLPITSDIGKTISV